MSKRNWTKDQIINRLIQIQPQEKRFFAAQIFHDMRLVNTTFEDMLGYYAAVVKRSPEFDRKEVVAYIKSLLIDTNFPPEYTDSIIGLIRELETVE